MTTSETLFVLDPFGTSCVVGISPIMQFRDYEEKMSVMAIFVRRDKPA